MNSPIQLTPNMDMQTLVNAINENFRQLELENRTKIMKDEEVTQRLLLGRAPNGEYLLAITDQQRNIIDELNR